LAPNLSKNILLSLWNPKVHRRVHKSPPLDPTLRQLNPVRPIDPYLPKVQLNVILQIHFLKIQKVCAETRVHNKEEKNFRKSLQSSACLVTSSAILFVIHE
jgi:hypothetical protein